MAFIPDFSRTCAKGPVVVDVSLSFLPRGLFAPTCANGHLNSHPPNSTNGTKKRESERGRRRCRALTYRKRIHLQATNTIRARQRCLLEYLTAIFSSLPNVGSIGGVRMCRLRHVASTSHFTHAERKMHAVQQSRGRGTIRYTRHQPREHITRVGPPRYWAVL